MKTCIEFLGDMIMIGGLIGLALGWRGKNFLRGLGWMVLAVVLTLPLRFKSEATALTYLAWCTAAFGMLQILGSLWFQWIPGVPPRVFHATGRFFLCFALSCGLIMLSELYVKHDVGMGWPPEIYGFISSIGIAVFALAGCSFLLLDHIIEGQQKAA